MISWMFPGQGSQRPAMAAGIAACGELFETARAVIGVDIEPLCVDPNRIRWTTQMLQPAVFTTTVGAALSLKALGERPQTVVGHSLGELTALVVAEAMSFEDALRLVWVRSNAMSEAARSTPGGMAAVLGLDGATVEEVCSTVDGVWPANFNSPTQTVISGSEEGLTEGAERCRAAGARRVKRLDVPVPAHTPLMAPARVELEGAVAEAELQTPAIAFYSAVDGKEHSSPDEIRALIGRGVTEPVRFVDTIRAIDAAGPCDFLEVGPGSALRGLVRQIAPDASVGRVSDDGEAEAFSFSFKRLSRA